MLQLSESGVQHLAIEFFDAAISVSTDVGQQPLSAQLTIPADIHLLYTAHVTVLVTMTTLSISRAPCVPGLLQCEVTATVQPGGEVIDIAGTLYIGGVPEFTPYVSSKFKSREGFRGCLGVCIGLSCLCSIDSLYLSPALFEKRKGGMKTGLVRHVRVRNRRDWKKAFISESIKYRNL